MSYPQYEQLYGDLAARMPIESITLTGRGNAPVILAKGSPATRIKVPAAHIFIAVLHAGECPWMVLKLVLPFQADGMGLDQEYFAWVPLHTGRQRTALRRFARAPGWYLVVFSGARVTSVLHFPIEDHFRRDCLRGARLLETVPLQPRADTRKAFNQMADLMAQLLGRAGRFRVLRDLAAGPGRARLEKPE